jgi:hypothetical protein
MWEEGGIKHDITLKNHIFLITDFQRSGDLQTYKQKIRNIHLRKLNKHRGKNSQ